MRRRCGRDRRRGAALTYSIIARCPRTGRFGIGTTTFSIACGRRNESLRANVGICKSQAFYRREADPFALNLLAMGYTPRHIARMLEDDDPDHEYRQYAIIDREGNVFAHTGASIGQWAGHRVGANYAAYGNGLAGPQTVEGIVAGFLAEPDAPLEYRLLRGIEGGHAAGGQATKGVFRPERSAWIRVVGQLDHPEIDLRVDLHDNTLARMHELFEQWKNEASDERARSDAPERPSIAPMTFSVVARCARSGRLGIGIAGDALAVGRHCDGALRAHSGASLTQGLPAPRNNRFASNLLAQGFTARHALRALLEADAAPGQRQIGVIDRAGGIALHSGDELPEWTGHKSGDGHLVLGCGLANRSILDAMVERLLANPHAGLEERLLGALEAGRDGQRAATGPVASPAARSAAIVVWGAADYSDIDLRVDLHERDAVAELRRTYEEFKPFKIYYDERARNPREALPQMEFADRLRAVPSAQRSGGAGD